AHRGTGVVIALLHDIIAMGAADLAAVALFERIAPEDVPGVDVWIVDPQRRAVEEARHAPHVLDGAPFQHPAEMDFAAAGVRPAVVIVDHAVHLPASNQPSVEAHFLCAVGRRAIAMQRSDEGWGGRCDHVPTLSYVRVVIRRPLSPSAAWEKLLVWGMALSWRLLAPGPGWSVSDVACTAGPHDRPFEERPHAACIAAVTEGTFQYRSTRGSAVLAPGAVLLGDEGSCFECGHTQPATAASPSTSRLIIWKRSWQRYRAHGGRCLRSRRCRRCPRSCRCSPPRRPRATTATTASSKNWPCALRVRLPRRLPARAASRTGQAGATSGASPMCCGRSRRGRPSSSR